MVLKIFNALTQRFHQYVNSPLNFNTLSGRQVLRMKIIISSMGINIYFHPPIKETVWIYEASHSNIPWALSHLLIIKKLSSTCEEFKFRGWYDAAFRLGQETHQILFEFQQTRWASRSKSRSRSQDVSSLAFYRRRIPNLIIVRKKWFAKRDKMFSWRIRFLVVPAWEW